MKGKVRLHQCYRWCGRQLQRIAEQQKLLSGNAIPLLVVCALPKDNWAGRQYRIVCEHRRAYYFEVDTEWI